MTGDFSGEITFQPFREEDLPLLHKWLNTPHVSEWWEVSGHHNPSFEVVAAKYRPRILREECVDCYVFYYDGMPIGMIQSGDLDDFPDEKAAFGLDGKCMGVDLAIGEEAYVHRGLGSIIIRKFIAEKVFSDETVEYCTIDPDPRNTIAVRAYRKVGFRHLRTVWNEKNSVEAFLMVMDRETFARS